MTRNNIIVLVIILLIFSFSLWTLLPLQSTVELVYQAQYSDNATPEEKTTIMAEALQAIQQSIDARTTKGTVEEIGDDSIAVGLSGLNDIDYAKSLVGEIDNFVITKEEVHGDRLGRAGLRLGLDLQGGVHLLYQADLSSVEPGSEAEIMKGIESVISNRINPLGVTEPIIQVQGTDRLMVDLPGLSITDKEKQRLSSVALLEFGYGHQTGSTRRCVTMANLMQTHRRNDRYLKFYLRRLDQSSHLQHQYWTVLRRRSKYLFQDWRTG